MNLRATTKSGNATPLMVAVGRNDERMVQILCECGADKSAIDHRGRTALVTAVLSGHVACVRVLSASGANMGVTAEGRTLVHLALGCNGSQEDMLRELIRSGVNVNGRGYSNMTCLMHVARTGRPELVRIMCEAGARVNDTNNGLTALHSAALPLTSNVDCVRELVAHGADVNYGADGDSPLKFACLTGNADIVRHLLQSGADPTIFDVDSLAPLHHATAAVALKVALAMLQEGCLETIANYDGTTPFCTVGKETKPLPHRQSRNRVNEAAMRRLLARGPAFRARSWSWPSAGNISQTTASHRGDNVSAAQEATRVPVALSALKLGRKGKKRSRDVTGIMFR